MKEKFKNMPYWVYDTLSVVSAIITILTGIFCVFNAAIDVNEIEGEYIVSFDKLLLCLCILLFFILFVVIIKLRKYSILLRRERKVLSYNYYNETHDFRNAYFDILKKHKKSQAVDREHRIEYLTKDTKQFLEKSLDYLCEIMETMTGREVHACIKLIENTGGSQKKINIQKATVKTFCRSKNSQPVRSANDNARKTPIKVVDNSDFYDILDSTDTDTNACFYQTNLLEFAKKRRESGKSYRNSTENWEQYYKSTIVAPIRVSNEHLFFSRLTYGYNVVGFLCVDSMATDAFRNRNVDKENLTYVVKSFAAETYIILNMYSYYLGKLKGEPRNEKNS